MDTIAKLDDTTTEALKADIATLDALMEGGRALQETIGGTEDEQDLAVLLDALDRQWVRTDRRVKTLALERYFARHADVGALYRDVVIIRGLLVLARHLHEQHCKRSHILAAIVRVGEAICETLQDYTVAVREARDAEPEGVAA